MGARDPDASMLMLVRHQWVRDHGTPRVSTLAGPRSAARALWHEWLGLSARARAPESLLEQPARAAESWLDEAAAAVAARAVRTPHAPLAILVDAALLDRWLHSRDHRVAAMIAEGLVRLPAGARPRPAPRAATRLSCERARSLAEAALLEALEATPATAGRFALNQRISVSFGSQAAEVDLLSRTDDIAIEVDGYHHFTDADHYRRDRRKDLLLQAHGYAVLRFLADDIIARPQDAVRTVAELLGHKLRRARQRRRT